MSLLEELLAGEAPADLERRVMAPRRDASALVARAEAEVASAPVQSFRADERGFETLVTSVGRWAAGRFEAPTIAELWKRARRGPRERRRCTLHVLQGRGPLADVATLQAFDDGRTVFQVASQFNCLEAPGPRVVPVADYFHDSTQGPRASISAFPGTLLRHYVANRPELDLLRDRPGVRVRAGYLTARDVLEPDAFLSSGLANGRVGVHEGVEVVLGHDWAGPVASPPPLITQVFTSTLAAGAYSHADLDAPGPLRSVAEELLKTAYLGTLLAALMLRKQRVLLTMIGGGVFGNPTDLIGDAVRWAIDAVERDGLGIDVVVNVYSGSARTFAGARVIPV